MEIIEITDFNVHELDVFARLTERQLMSSQSHGESLFIAESPKVIERALEAGYEPVSLLCDSNHINGAARDIIARCGDIPLYAAEEAVLEQLTGFPLTRGVLCAMRRKPISPVSEVISGARRVVVIESVMNPTNVGAIFRSAAALGMDAVLLTPGSCDPLYRRAIRVSMGAVFQVPWTYIGEEPEDWAESGVETLHSLGFRTAAMALRDDSVSIDDRALNSEKRLAVVLGTEGDGLSDGTIADCDYTVRIPMSHGVDSLNVAAASAVAFWQLGKMYNKD